MMRTSGSKRTPASQALCFFVDRDGRQHFNFTQHLWLDSRVPMGYTRRPSTALMTLAANLLARALLPGDSRRDSTLAVAMASRCALLFASEFCQECLLDAPAEGWIMPRAAIRAWLVAHLRRAKPSRLPRAVHVTQTGSSRLALSGSDLRGAAPSGHWLLRKPIPPAA